MVSQIPQKGNCNVSCFTVFSEVIINASSASLFDKEPTISEEFRFSILYICYGIYIISRFWTFNFMFHLLVAAFTVRNLISFVTQL